jgi:anhydro-N-acetylmuramic acid kinase
VTNYYIGLMSGTSLDAIDAVLVRLDGTPGHNNDPELIASHKHPLPDTLRDTLLALNRPAHGELAKMAEADILLGREFADAVLNLCAHGNVAPHDIKAIGSHGQTIRHVPDGDPAWTVQIGDANTIAERTGITTVADFRRRDMAAGGQGAPLMPAVHNALLRVHDQNRVILNIGGMANITLLPADPEQPVSGFDTGPGNVLMDHWAREHHGQPYDHNGAWAATGKVDEALLAAMLKDKYFQQAPPKSTGRDLFNAAWLNRHLKRGARRRPHKHVQATLCELTARSIADAINAYAAQADTVIVCGGGVHNTTLMFRLQALLEHRQVRSSEDYDLDPDWLEAIGFAWLAKRTLEGLPGNLPAVTGARHPVVLGAIYAGHPAGRD